MFKKSLFIFLALLSFSTTSFADDVEFPDEELARESVLPVFEKPRSVLNRNVTTAERIEIGGGVGVEVNEPYYKDMNFLLQGTYHFNESHALNVQGIMWGDGLSSYGQQLRNGEGSGVEFDPSKAPHPKWALIGNYEFVAYYGKISFSKQGVMHLNLFGLAGLGYLNMDSANTFVLNLGIGQNFYFTQNFALRVDIRELIFRGPNATSQALDPNDPAPPAGSFDNRLFFNTQLSLSAIFVL